MGARMIDSYVLKGKKCSCGAELKAFLVSPDGERARPIGTPGIVDEHESEWQVLLAGSSAEAKEFVRTSSYERSGHDIVRVNGSSLSSPIRGHNRDPIAELRELAGAKKTSLAGDVTDELPSLAVEEPARPRGVPGRLEVCVQCPNRVSLMTIDVACCLVKYAGPNDWSDGPQITRNDGKFACSAAVQ